MVRPKKSNVKTRREIDHDYYQKNQEKRREQARIKWREKQACQIEQAAQGLKDAVNKYYEAESIRVLMSLKEYTELNSAKHKIWLNFIWTFKDLNEIGISNLIEVMKIRELAENLLNDYWTTAKNEKRKRQSWPSLSEEKQQRLIKYWGREKARKEQNLNEKLTELDKKGELFEKEIELAKFHEERGKIKCVCWQCAESKKIQPARKKNFLSGSTTKK